jgi:hypothetical protein
LKNGTGILPVRLCGIGILPMIHGLEAHATMIRLFKYFLKPVGENVRKFAYVVQKGGLQFERLGPCSQGGKSMAKDTDSLDLTDRQKTRLLHLALGPSDPGEPRGEDEERGDLLHDILRCFLPLRAGLREGSRAAATASCQGLRSVVGPPIGELLQDPKTSVAMLKEIKQYAKARGSQAASEREKDVFLAIYFAAIAAAIVFHAGRITEHANRDLARFFRSCGHTTWMPPNLVELFMRARERCEVRGQRNDDFVG